MINCQILNAQLSSCGVILPADNLNGTQRPVVQVVAFTLNQTDVVVCGIVVYGQLNDCRVRVSVTVTGQSCDLYPGYTVNRRLKIRGSDTVCKARGRVVNDLGDNDIELGYEKILKTLNELKSQVK